MPHVTALYRYPVKGFTPEPCEQLRVQSDGRASGDRVLAFRFAGAATPEERDGLDYWPKRRGLALMTFPSLARLCLAFDGEVLRIDDGPATLVQERLDEAGRARITERVTRWLQDSPDARLLQRPGVLPLQLVGDGTTAQFQDRPQGFVSLHGAASTTALGTALAGAGDDRRYRSNIVVSGIEPWSELGWHGRVRIGAVEFEVRNPITRCLATHANPDTGTRDADVLPTLVQRFGHREPTMGVLLSAVDGDGVIQLGDEVRDSRSIR